MFGKCRPVREKSKTRQCLSLALTDIKRESSTLGDIYRKLKKEMKIKEETIIRAPRPNGDRKRLWL